MLDLSRRSFLRGALALGGLAIVRPITPAFSIPEIWGDGIHDDADGLNALLAREPVNIMTDLARIDRAEMIFLQGGRFLVSRPIKMGSFTHIQNASFIQTPSFKGDFLFKGQVIENVILDFRVVNDPVRAQGMHHITVVRTSDGVIRLEEECTNIGFPLPENWKKDKQVLKTQKPPTA